MTDLPHPLPLTGRSEQVQNSLDMLARLLPPEPTHRDPLQHEDCHWIAGTRGCLESGGQMCMECSWWTMTALEADDV